MSNERRKILIVDDDIDVLAQMKFHVENFGFDTLTAESQEEGEKILSEQKPDLAIFDLMMENQDSGFILAYKTKKLYPDVPVIIATAVSSETGLIFGLDEDEKNWIKADQYLEKSIRPDQLKREINKLLKL